MKHCQPPWLTDKENFFISNRLKRLEKHKYLQEASDVNFHHKQVFIAKLFIISSQTRQVFSIIGGLKFRFEVLNVFNYKSQCSN